MLCPDTKAFTRVAAGSSIEVTEALNSFLLDALLSPARRAALKDGRPQLLRPAPNDVLQPCPVSKRVNSSRADANDATVPALARDRIGLRCIDKECGDSLFAKSFGGLQPVQTLNKYEARAVRPHSDRRACRPFSRMLAAISSNRFCSRVARRLIGT